MSARVGILGGGQLGRMLALAGHPLGIRTRCLDRSESAPAAGVSELVIGDYEDERALAELSDCDVVTFEWESVPERAAASMIITPLAIPEMMRLRLGKS